MKRMVLLPILLAILLATPAWAMRVIVDLGTGEIINTVGPNTSNGKMVEITHKAAIEATLARYPEESAAASGWDSFPAPNLATAETWLRNLDKLVATVENGRVAAINVVEPPTLWVHLTFSGGQTSSAGTLYVINNGVDALQVTAQLRAGQASDSAAVTALPDGTPITGMWALELVDDLGVLRDAPIVNMVDGAISATYTTTIAPAILHLDEKRFATVGGYKIRLAVPAAATFKVVRTL